MLWKESEILMINFLIKLLFPFALIVSLLCGCNIDESTISPVKVLVGGGPGVDFCLFEINKEGIVVATSCTVNNTDISGKNFIKEILEKKSFKLSGSDKKLIADLILQITENDPIEEISFLDVNEITALINNQFYHSTYDYYDAMNYDKNLAELTYKLVELSPIQVGGEHNPITQGN